MFASRLVIFASLLGLTGVAAGAFGAHGLRETLEATNHLETWKTAAHYQLIHAVALLALAAWQAHSPSTWARRAGLCWLTGTLLFSGSLYALALGGPKWLGPVTPLGGLLLIIGWGLLLPASRPAKASP
jgi:uncharacterized membrane protein YgdD (TMEM256/DUF423 family)